jgi:hypothetical protein
MDINSNACELYQLNQMAFIKVLLEENKKDPEINSFVRDNFPFQMKKSFIDFSSKKQELLKFMNYLEIVSFSISLIVLV